MFKAAEIGPLEGLTIGKKSASMGYDGESEAKTYVNIEAGIATCEAVNCFAQATTTIEVEAGHQRTISLLLCEECVSKFRDEAE